MKTIVRQLATAAVAFLFAVSARAQEHTFKIMHVFAQTHWHWTEGIKVFIDEVEKASGGKFKFEAYHAGAGWVRRAPCWSHPACRKWACSFHPTKLTSCLWPRSPTARHAHQCLRGNEEILECRQGGGALYEAEYKPLGVRPLYVILLPPYQLMTTNKKVTTMADVSGMKRVVELVSRDLDGDAAKRTDGLVHGRAIGADLYRAAPSN